MGKVGLTETLVLNSFGEVKEGDCETFGRRLLSKGLSRCKVPRENVPWWMWKGERGRVDASRGTGLGHCGKVLVFLGKMF